MYVCLKDFMSNWLFYLFVGASSTRVLRVLKGAVHSQESGHTKAIAAPDVLG
jgi:hypothetical protein